MTNAPVVTSRDALTDAIRTAWSINYEIMADRLIKIGAVTTLAAALRERRTDIGRWLHDRDPRHSPENEGRYCGAHCMTVFDGSADELIHYLETAPTDAEGQAAGAGA